LLGKNGNLWHADLLRQPSSRLAAVERGIRSLQTSDAAIVRSLQDGFSQTESRFVQMETRFVQIYNHVDGFMKLHEALGIEFRVIKE